jgi:hypothetical protein
MNYIADLSKALGACQDPRTIDQCEVRDPSFDTYVYPGECQLGYWGSLVRAQYRPFDTAQPGGNDWLRGWSGVPGEAGKRVACRPPVQTSDAAYGCALTVGPNKTGNAAAAMM